MFKRGLICAALAAGMMCGDVNGAGRMLGDTSREHEECRTRFWDADTLLRAKSTLSIAELEDILQSISDYAATICVNACDGAYGNLIIPYSLIFGRHWSFVQEQCTVSAKLRRLFGSALQYLPCALISCLSHRNIQFDLSLFSSSNSASILFEPPHNPQMAAIRDLLRVASGFRSQS